MNIDCQRCINLYPERDELGTGKEGEQWALLGTPGLTTLVTIATSPIRGIITGSDGILYAVAGNKFYKISSLWVATELGTLVSSTGNVSMEDNGIQLIIVDGANGYYWTFGDSTFNDLDDPDFVGANQVGFLDQYFIFNKPLTGQFYISDLAGIGIDPLDFATAEGSPDNIVGFIVFNRELWLMGEKTIEIYFNSGAAAFPFERTQGAFIEQGCGARFSIAKSDKAVFWLGKNDKGTGVVYMAQGPTPQRISTFPVEEAIQGYSDVSDAVAFVYQQEGHDFYVLNFPTANTTWVFDISTGFWHERAYSNNGVLERHRANYHAFAYGKHIVGDYATGKIYELSTSVYSDDDAYITRKRVAPHATGLGKRMRHMQFQLDMEVGVGLDGATTLQGNDPKAILTFSDDGGHSWSNEKWESIGKIGERRQRVNWHRLGMSRDRVYSVTITDPVKVVLLGANIELEGEAS